jgi:hypothetical protein
MSSINSITAEKLARLIGTPKCPALVDVRSDDDFATEPRLIPGAVRRSPASATQARTNGRPSFAGNRQS